MLISALQPSGGVPTGKTCKRQNTRAKLFCLKSLRDIGLQLALSLYRPWASATDKLKSATCMLQDILQTSFDLPDCNTGHIACSVTKTTIFTAGRPLPGRVVQLL